MQYVILLICVITLILIIDYLFNQERSWQETLKEWAQSKGFHLNKSMLGRFPSFSGLYEGYECTIDLIPLGLGTEIIFLCTRIEVFTKKNSFLLSPQKFGETKNIHVDLGYLDKHYYDLVHNLLISMELNRNLLIQSGSQLFFSPDKISYIINGANVELDNLREALDILIELARQIDRTTLIIKSGEKRIPDETFI